MMGECDILFNNLPLIIYIYIFYRLFLVSKNELCT